uniref:Putative secreted protein n=1 Tax=Ixodes ricinus TaxID=34613 RepID=A0A090X9B7_IXORI
MKVFALAFCLFDPLIGVSLAVEKRSIDEYWQEYPKLGSFQNAWEAINEEVVYYLSLATSNLQYQCVKTTITATFPENKTIHYRYLMYNGPASKTEEINGAAYVDSDVRGTESIIHTMVKDFQLWVNEKEFEFLPRCCEFIFTFLTYKMNWYRITDKKIC